MFQEPATDGTRNFDPRDAWMLFIRQSDKGVNGKRGGRGKARKLKVSTRAPSSVCVCVSGDKRGASTCGPPGAPSLPPSPPSTLHQLRGSTLSMASEDGPSPLAWGQRARKVPGWGTRRP